MYSKDEYITDYSKFEQWCQEHGYADVKDLQYTYPYKSPRWNDLDFYRHLRNYLVHIPDVNQRIKITEQLKSDFDILRRRLMLDLEDVAIPINRIFKRQISDTIGPTIKIMKERVYTHTPIMNGRKVWGVFSENTLFNLAEKEDFTKFDRNTSFMEIAPYITSYSRTSVYDFITPKVSLDDVKRIFRNATENGHKLEVLFITTTGRQDGDLLGMITIWDLTTIE